MPSRRRLLAALGGGTLTMLAGCSGSSSSSSADCTTGARNHGDGDLLDGGAMATTWGDGETVRLHVPLDAAAVEEQGMTALELFVGDRLDTRIPVSAADEQHMSDEYRSEGQLRYVQTLGERPLHGEYRLDAVDEDGETLDTVTVSFHCFAENDSDS